MNDTPASSTASAAASLVGAGQKKTWQTPHISPLGVDDTETAAAASFEVMGFNMCVGYAQAKDSRCTVT
jgi:hypothetical protein